MDHINLSNVRQRFGGAVYNWKVHEVAAEDAEFYIGKMRFLNIILTTLTIIVLVLPQITTWEYINTAALILGVAQIVFLVVQLYFSFEDKRNSHKRSALEFQNLRNSYVLLMSDIVNNLDSDSVVIRRDELNEIYRLICAFSPQTTRKQYEKTRTRLNINSVKEGEDFTLSEEEIDHFLTGNLKQTRGLS